MKIGYLMQQGVDFRAEALDGPGQHVAEVVDHLRELGHDVPVVIGIDGQFLVASSTVQPLNRSEWRDILSRPGLVERALRRVQRVLRLPYLNLFESWRFARACQRVLSKCDVLYERVSWTGFGGVMAARLLNCPLVVEYNGDPLHDLDAKGIGPHGVQRKLTARLTGWAIRQADWVVASGEGWRQQLVETWRVDPARTSLVENGTGLVETLERSDLRSLKLKTTGAGTLALVYLGGFQPWQGVGVLLGAVAEARSFGIDVTLTLIGDGPGKDEMYDQAAELDLVGVCTFTGRLMPEHYGGLLAEADAGVSPYCGWAEFAGLKILDYKAAGLPTIASGRDGQPSTITHEVTGLVVPPCNGHALAAAIVRLAEDPSLRRKMGQKARAEAEQQHSWGIAAQSIESILQGVAKRD